MSPPPVEQTGESADAHRSLPTPFLTKTYQIVEDPSVDDIVSWNDEGSTFIVWKPAEFARDLLPKYFKHNNFSSFVRQLNTYGFRKIVPDRWEFANDFFKKGEKHLLCDIHRRKISPAVNTHTHTPASTTPIQTATPAVRTGSPSNSGDEQVLSSNSPPVIHPVPVVVPAILCRTTSCTSTADLLEENERLRRENHHLTKELSQMKSLCNSIYALMNKYASSQQENNSEVRELTELQARRSPPLDLMPMKRCEYLDEAGAGQSSTKILDDKDDTTPRLFGVPIGTKRCRREEEEDQEQQQEQEQEDGTEETEPMKSEPLDGSASPQESEWMML